MLDLHECFSETGAKIVCSSTGTLQVPDKGILDFCRREAMNPNHLLRISCSRLNNSDAEIESSIDARRRFNSSARLGSSIDIPGIGSATESNISVARRIRSASGSDNTDVIISSCAADIKTSGDRTLQCPFIPPKNAGPSHPSLVNDFFR